MRLKRVVEFMTENLSEDSCLSMFHFVSGAPFTPD